MTTYNTSFHYPFLILLISVLLSGIACAGKKTNAPTNKDTPAATLTNLQENESMNTPKVNFPYDLDTPIEEISLPNRLKEISGLGIDPTGQYLYAVQDEEGDIFLINRKTKEVEERIKFHKEGDYEGIEWIEDRAYVVKSTGTLYEIHDLGKPTQKRTKHKFNFNKSSDVEGLGYDPVTNTLLVSCKGKALRGEKAELQKGIYEIKLDNMTMDSIPKYTISLEEIKTFLKTNQTLEYFDKLIKIFKPEEEFIFGPSGIAVHPINKEIYVISAVGNVLLVLDRSNQIKHLKKLRKKIHQQPEGIIFDQQGNLYISNEGKEGKGKILMFAYQNNE